MNLGKDINLDIQTLVATRLLVQANSGGGKSYALRKLLEATHGKVQHIVLDIEGDFSSLREKFDYILAGKGGDIEANPKHAAFLARKVLELKTDIIVDLYELKQHERIRFVKEFCDAITNAPKELWHPALVVLDEAHIFCPEKGQAESMSAVIDLCTRGRKRGFCAILATQRLSKLNKDAAAECNNKLIGRTGLDIDLKRAIDELGLSSNSGRELKNLEPGEFFFFGPALSREVSKGKIGETKTSHPRAGLRNLSYKAAPSATVKSALLKLGELAKQAEEEAVTVADLRRKVKELEKEKRIVVKPHESEISKEEIQKIADRLVVSARKELEKQMSSKMKSLRDSLLEVISKFGKAELEVPPRAELQLKPASFTGPKQTVRQTSPRFSSQPGDTVRSDGLGQCERKILGFLASQAERSFTKVQIGAMTGYAHSSGGFHNAISKLSRAGLIERSSGNTRITESGIEWIEENGADTPHKLADWVTKLGACERAIYEFLLSEPHDNEWSKEEVAERTGYAHSSGGFHNSLSRLNTLGLIQRERGGVVKLNPDVVEVAGI